MKIFNIIKNIFLDIIIVLLVLLLGFEFINRGKPVPIFDHYLFVVMSGSMQNTLYVGDHIIVKKTDNYKVNDIITYKLDDKYITHRIVNIDGDKVTTKGDANVTNDKPIDKKDIVGKFIYKSSLLNFVMNNKILIIIVAILLMIIDSLITKIKKEGKENNKEKEEIDII